MSLPETLHSDPSVLLYWTERKRCVACHKTFDEPWLRPVAEEDRGKFKPNFNPEILFHMQDTHGLHHHRVMEWIIESIYDQEMGAFLGFSRCC